MLAYAGLTFSSVAWALAFVLGKIVVGEMMPLAVATWRFVAAALVLLPFALREGRPRGLGAVALPLAIMVVCGGLMYQWMFFAALARTSATNTALLVALNPVLTLLLSPLIGEQLRRQQLMGVVLALAGAVLVITKGDLGHLGQLTLAGGDLLALAAAAMWAAFNLASRRVVAQLSPSFTNCVVYSCGGVALLLIGWGEQPWAQLAAASPGAVGSILVMAVLASVLAGQLFLVGVRVLGVSHTVVFVYLVPVITALLSRLALGEQFELAQAAGGSAVLAGVYWTTRRRA